MKKNVKYILLIIICISSFYFTEKIALYVKMRNPIIKDINSIKNDKYTEYTNCLLIDENYIIPGLNGREINIDKSFRQMKNSTVFNEDLLVYNQIIPQNSLENNKDRIIIRGNSKKNNVSLIFSSDNNLAKYMQKNNYIVNVLIDKEIYPSNYELINNAHSKDTYTKIEKTLNKNKLNNNLCYTKNDNIPKYCKDKYLFKESLIINHSNLSQTINKIKNGEIILIENSLTIEELNVLLKQIKYQSLSIVPLSKLISETN